MEFPHHHHHRHGHGEEEEEEEGRRRGEEPYYPPPGYSPYGAPRGWEPPPPPPPFPSPPPTYGGGEGEYRPWDADQRAGYGPGPVYPAVQHVAHEVRPGPVYPVVQHAAHEVRPDPYAAEREEEEDGGRGQHWWHRRHGDGHSRQGEPFSVQHVSHETCGSGGVAPAARPRTVRVFTKAREDHSLSIRDGKVILARADRGDEYQVRLIPYNPDYLDESILWTEASDTGEGFRAIRMVNNTSLNFDAFHGDDDHGGVHDGTIVVLGEWWKGKNQRWKMVPY